MINMIKWRRRNMDFPKNLKSAVSREERLTIAAPATKIMTTRKNIP